MVDVNYELRSEMDSLRGDLHNLLVSENCNNEKILKLSQELDKVIIRYIMRHRCPPPL